MALAVTNDRQGSKRRRGVKRDAAKAWHVSVKGASGRAMGESASSHGGSGGRVSLLRSRGRNDGHERRAARTARSRHALEAMLP